MSASFYDQLIERITEEGLTEAEARTPVTRCVKHVDAVGAMSYYGPAAGAAEAAVTFGPAPGR
jgi:hypothetical protein